jgi:hypothetical protein
LFRYSQLIVCIPPFQGVINYESTNPIRDTRRDASVSLIYESTRIVDTDAFTS